MPLARPRQIGGFVADLGLRKGDNSSSGPAIKFPPGFSTGGIQSLSTKALPRPGPPAGPLPSPTAAQFWGKGRTRSSLNIGRWYQRCPPYLVAGVDLGATKVLDKTQRVGDSATIDFQRHIVAPSGFICPQVPDDNRICFYHAGVLSGVHSCSRL